MDFDGNNKKGLVNWNYEEKKMKTLRTIMAVFTPVFAVSFMFSVNVIKLDGTKRLQLAQKEELNLVVDESQTWYAQIARKELSTKSLAKR